MGALSILLAFVRGSLAPLMQNALWCPLVCLLPLGIVGVTSLSYIPAIILKISIMSSLMHLNNNIGRPIVFRCSEYSRCFRLGTCFWLSFVPFLIQLYPSSYLAPKLLLMFRWVVLLSKKLKKHILVKIIKSSSDDGHHSIGFILVYMWSLKLKLSSTWIPISSQVVASSLTWFPSPSSEFFTMLKVGGVSSSLYPNYSTLHLSGRNLRSQSDDRLHTYIQVFLSSCFIFRCICSGIQFCTICENNCCWVVLNIVREVVDVQDK